MAQKVTHSAHFICKVQFSPIFLSRIQEISTKIVMCSPGAFQTNRAYTLSTFKFSQPIQNKRNPNHPKNRRKKICRESHSFFFLTVAPFLNSICSPWKPFFLLPHSHLSSTQNLLLLRRFCPPLSNPIQSPSSSQNPSPQASKSNLFHHSKHLCQYPRTGSLMPSKD